MPSPAVTRSRTKFIVTPSPIPQYDGPDKVSLVDCDPVNVSNSSSDLEQCMKEDVVISSGVRKYDLRSECYGCQCSIHNDTIIQCCFVCPALFCMKCLDERNEHQDHWCYLHKPMTLHEYIDRPIYNPSEDPDTGQS